MSILYNCDPYHRELSLEFRNDIEFGIKILTKLLEKMESWKSITDLPETIKKIREFVVTRELSSRRDTEVKQSLQNKNLISWEEMEEDVKRFRSLGGKEQGEILERATQFLEKRELKKQGKKLKKKKKKHQDQKNKIEGVRVYMIKDSGSLAIVFSGSTIPFGFEMIDYLIILAKNGIGEEGFASPQFINFVEKTKKLMDFNNQPNSNLH